MIFNTEIKQKIKEKENLFFDKSSKRHGDMTIFKEIFEIIDDSNFEKNYPEHYFEELKRIRDLHNSLKTAREEGRRSAMKTH